MTRHPSSKWSLLLPLLAACSLTTAAPTHRRTEPEPPCEPAPVCIIGAGPAGLSAARRLEDKGIDAVIFDKQEEVGG